VDTQNVHKFCGRFCPLGRPVPPLGDPCSGRGCLPPETCSALKTAQELHGAQAAAAARSGAAREKLLPFNSLEKWARKPRPGLGNLAADGNAACERHVALPKLHRRCGVPKRRRRCPRELLWNCAKLANAQIPPCSLKFLHRSSRWQLTQLSCD